MSEQIPDQIELQSSDQKDQRDEDDSNNQEYEENIVDKALEDVFKLNKKSKASHNLVKFEQNDLEAVNLDNSIDFLNPHQFQENLHNYITPQYNLPINFQNSTIIHNSQALMPNYDTIYSQSIDNNQTENIQMLNHLSPFQQQSSTKTQNHSHLMSPSQYIPNQAAYHYDQNKVSNLLIMQAQQQHHHHQQQQQQQQQQHQQQQPQNIIHQNHHHLNQHSHQNQNHILPRNNNNNSNTLINSNNNASSTNNKINEPNGFQKTKQEFDDNQFKYPKNDFCKEYNSAGLKMAINSDDQKQTAQGPEIKQPQFEYTLTGFVIQLFSEANVQEILEHQIIEEVAKNIAYLKRPDGTQYKGDLHKTIKGSLTSNGIFSKKKNQDGEQLWCLKHSVAQDFECRTIQRITHLNQKKQLLKKRKLDEHTQNADNQINQKEEISDEIEQSKSSILPFEKPPVLKIDKPESTQNPQMCQFNIRNAATTSSVAIQPNSAPKINFFNQGNLYTHMPNGLPNYHYSPPIPNIGRDQYNSYLRLFQLFSEYCNLFSKDILENQGFKDPPSASMKLISPNNSSNQQEKAIGIIQFFECFRPILVYKDKPYQKVKQNLPNINQISTHQSLNEADQWNDYQTMIPPMHDLQIIQNPGQSYFEDTNEQHPSYIYAMNINGMNSLGGLNNIDFLSQTSVPVSNNYFNLK